MVGRPIDDILQKLSENFGRFHSGHIATLLDEGIEGT
jgi:hypothetical protein